MQDDKDEDELIFETVGGETEIDEDEEPDDDEGEGEGEEEAATNPLDMRSDAANEAL